ncbi:MAG TPA: protein translocase subunit SecD [Acidimicrobiia bacterium]|nr:protein translocase subunit SecD [Acidimicrobiia bacterium]
MTRRLTGLIIVLAIAWGLLAAIIALGWTPLLGLDLQGGTAVVLTAPEGTDPDLIEVATVIMTRRIEDFGAVQEPDIAISGSDTVVVQLPGVEDEQRAIEAVGKTGLLSFRPVLEAFPGSAGPLAGTDTPAIDNETGLTVNDNINEEAYLLYPDPNGGEQVLHVGPAELEGSDVSEAIPRFITTSGTWAVSLDLNSEGGNKFAQLTGQAATFPVGDPQREIAIVLDGKVISAPSVNPDVTPGVGITGGRALITMGSATDAEQEAQDLALTLRYGSLPVPFDVSAVQKVSGSLGDDSLRAGITAGVLGLILVIAVLLVVYRSLGLVAIVGLTVFAALLIALFGLLGQAQGLTLTLAGVTGIIVSVGITADSYIVYYERIKEKIREGLSPQDAADEGFALAFRTILTADTVSLIAAILLWFLAVGAVKGFAMALGLATILDIVIARTFTRRAVGVIAPSGLGSGGWFSIEGAAK